MPFETFTLPEDRLAVTVASASPQQADPLNSDLTIWVGEIELQGRNTIWVELIDTYGEVIYDSEVNTNETHLLPDGRAVVVRSLDPDTRIAKKDVSRVPLDGQMLVTRRVVDDGDHSATVELIETKDEQEKSPMLHLAEFGQSVWGSVLAIYKAAADRVQVAWSWLVDTIHA
ncbi:hypothetical protein E1297_11865 [Roseibium sp. RKSG952]|nr:hypothetical protein [Roseibium sp. RKSG952]